MAVTITPLQMAAINMAIELALMQLSKTTKGMNRAELLAYIDKQEKRKIRLLKQLDEA